jgi:hypothetical protein
VAAGWTWLLLANRWQNSWRSCISGAEGTKSCLKRPSNILMCTKSVFYSRRYNFSQLIAKMTWELLTYLGWIELQGEIAGLHLLGVALWRWDLCHGQLCYIFWGLLQFWISNLGGGGGWSCADHSFWSRHRGSWKCFQDWFATTHFFFGCLLFFGKASSWAWLVDRLVDCLVLVVVGWDFCPNAFKARTSSMSTANMESWCWVRACTRSLLPSVVWEWS